MIKWLKRIWKIHIKRECPVCGGRVYCKGPVSETETCMDCIWDEFNQYGEYDDGPIIFRKENK